MAFDRSNPTHLAELLVEVQTDPVGQDYASVISVTELFLAKFNDPAQNAAPQTIQRPIEEVDIPDIAGVIDEGEFDLLLPFNKVWVEMFINRPMEETLKPYQAKFLQVFPGGSATRTAALALLDKAASRGEVLWGVNTVITLQDWLAAKGQL